MKKTIFFLIVFAVSFNYASAQHDAQFTQHTNNLIAVNPAYAGSRGNLSVTALHRSQWVGLKGAPKTQILSINTPMSEKVGVGLSIINDNVGNGTNQETYFDAMFSYALEMGQGHKLAFGLKAGGHLLNLNFSKLANYKPNANLMGADIKNKFSPNFGAGLFYYSDTFFAGLSVPNFLETEHFENSGLENDSYIIKDRMNYYLIAGSVFELNHNLKFKPSTLVKAVKGAPVKVDLATNFLLNNKFSFGVAYRWSAAFSGMIGLQVTDQLMLGLSYDKETTDLGGIAFNDGSFEVVLRYEIKTRNNRNRTIIPRFF